MTEERSEKFLEYVAVKFRMLSEPIRLKIIYKLKEKPLHVMEVVKMVGTTQANISKHLTLMYSAGILDKQRDGNKLFYSISDKLILEMIKSFSDFSRNLIKKQKDL